MFESDVKQVLLLCVVGGVAHRSRSRKRSAVGTAGWMTLHWLQKKKDTRGTCSVQPRTFRHIGTCILPLMWRACLAPVFALHEQLHDHYCSPLHHIASTHGRLIRRRTQDCCRHQVLRRWLSCAGGCDATAGSLCILLCCCTG